LPRRLMACEGQVRDYAIILLLVDKYIGQSYAKDYVNLYMNIDRHSFNISGIEYFIIEYHRI